MATIKGKWQWNEIIDAPDDEISASDISFLSDNQSPREFTRITILFSYYYYGDNSQPVSVNYADSATHKVIDRYRIMDFGEEEQAVSDDFYEVFIANASPYTEPDIAEKLIQIAENQQKVYNAGYEAAIDRYTDRVFTIGIPILYYEVEDPSSVSGISDGVLDDLLFGPAWEKDFNKHLTLVLYNIQGESVLNYCIDKYYYIETVAKEGEVCDKWRKVEGGVQWETPEKIYVYTRPVAQDFNI